MAGQIVLDEVELGWLTHPEAFEVSLPWDFFVDDCYVCRVCGEEFDGRHEEAFVGHILEMHADEALDSGHIVVDEKGWDVDSMKLAAAFAA